MKKETVFTYYSLHSKFTIHVPRGNHIWQMKMNGVPMCTIPPVMPVLSGYVNKLNLMFRYVTVTVFHVLTLEIDTTVKYPRLILQLADLDFNSIFKDRNVLLNLIDCYDPTTKDTLLQYVSGLSPEDCPICDVSSLDGGQTLILQEPCMYHK